MTVSIKDRVKQSTTTTGTGTITLSSTPSGYQSFSSVFSNGDTVYYVIENGSMYEIGVGTYSAGTLSRDTVLKSSSGTSLITLSGRSTVFVAVPADKTIYINDTNKASIGLGNLSNVSLTSPASGDIVTYNGSTWSNGNFTEQIQDAVAASFVAGTGIDISYNDGLNTISVSSSGLLQSALNLSDLSSAATARTNLGLGTAALSNSGDFYLSTNPSGYISASSVAAGYQPLDGDLTSLAAVTGVDTIYYRSATSTWSPVVIGTGILFSGGTLSNTLDLSSYATSSGVAASYVPYIGATGAVNLGSQSLTAGAITASSLLTVDTICSSAFSHSSRYIYLNSSAVYAYTINMGLGLISNPWGTSYISSLSVVDGTNAQTLQVYGTYTSATNGEFIRLRGVAASNFEFGPSNGSVGGTLRGLTIGGYANGSSTITPWLTFTNTGAATFSGAITVGSCTDLTCPNGIALITDGNRRIGLGYSGRGIQAASALTIGFASTAAIDGSASDAYFVRNSASSIGVKGAAGIDGSLTAGAITASGQFTNALGTITTSAPLTLTQTWNAGGVTFNSMLINITDTASASLSLFADWQVGGVTKFSVDKRGYGKFVLGLEGQDWIRVTSDTAGFSIGTNSDVQLYRDAADTLAQRRSTNAQTFRVYNTYTSSTNYEYGLLSWASNVFRIGTSAGSGGGTMRDTAFGVLDTAGNWKPVLTINANSGVPGVTITPYNNSGLTYTSATLSSSYFTVSTESTEVNFNLSSTKTWPTGAITTQRAFRIQAPTYAFNGASTITTASTLSISGAPIAGTNATITNSIALNVDAGFAAAIPVRINGAASQSGNLLEVRDSGGNIGFMITSGYVVTANRSGGTPNGSFAASETGSGYQFQGGWGGLSANGGSMASGNLLNSVYGWTIRCGSGYAVDIVNGTNTQTLRLFNTFTSSTNAEWFQQSWASNEARLGTAVGSVGGTQRSLILGAWDSAGTFSPKVVIQPTSTGAIYFESATAGTTRGQYAIDLQLYRSASSQVASDYGVTIGTQCTASGGTGSVAIGRNVSVADSIGGAVGIGRSVSVTGYRGVGIGYSTTAGSDSLALGTASYAAHAGAICLMGSMSRWTGYIIWEGSAAAEGVFGAAYNLPYIGTHTGGREQATIAVRTTSNTLTTLQSIAVGTGYTTGNRQKHKSVLYHGDFVITAMRSDGACAKFARRVLVKSLADAAGSTYTFSVLQSETIGTDINEISGSAISFATTASTQTVDIQVQGESSYACTGVSATNIITAVGHPYANDDIIVFLTLTGGSSLQANPSGQYYLATYKVINVSGNTFQIATPGSSTTPLALGSDISAGTVSRPIIWTKVSGKFAVVTSGY